MGDARIELAPYGPARQKFLSERRELNPVPLGPEPSGLPMTYAPKFRWAAAELIPVLAFNLRGSYLFKTCQT